jgi:hypothetical protein
VNELLPDGVSCGFSEHPNWNAAKRAAAKIKERFIILFS